MVNKLRKRVILYTVASVVLVLALLMAHRTISGLTTELCLLKRNRNNLGS